MSRPVNRQWLLARRPEGPVSAEDFRLVETPAPEPADGEALVRNLYLSVDPTQRGWMAGDTYLPAVKIGEVMRSFAVGRGGRVPPPRLQARPARPGALRLAGLRHRPPRLPILSHAGPAGGPDRDGDERARAHRDHRLLRAARRGSPEARRDGGGLRRRGRDRFGRRPDRPDRRAAASSGSPAVRRSAPTSPGSSGSTAPSTTGPATSARRSAPSARRASTSSSTTSGGPVLDVVLAPAGAAGPDRPLRRHRPLQRRPARRRPGQLPRPRHEAGAHGGLHRPRLPGPRPARRWPPSPAGCGRGGSRTGWTSCRGWRTPPPRCSGSSRDGTRASSSSGLAAPSP